jgi:hypothetical protein
MEGGGNIPSESFVLGDIGNYKDVEDLFPIVSATLIVMNAVMALARFTSLGGVSLNAYIDSFGLEGVIWNTAHVALVFQVAKWVYTTFYATGGKMWSPLVFVCIVLSIQFVHDLIYYYGLLKNTTPGKNELVDAMSRYAAENGSRALGGAAAAMIFISAIAMILKESSLLFNTILLLLSLHILPYLIATVGVKPPPPPPPPSKKENPDMSRWNGPRF